LSVVVDGSPNDSIGGGIGEFLPAFGISSLVPILSVLADASISACMEFEYEAAGGIYDAAGRGAADGRWCCCCLVKILELVVLEFTSL